MPMNLSFNLSLPTDLAIIFGILGSLVTFFKGVMEYSKQGSEKRADRFFKLEREFLSNNAYKTICNFLENDDLELSKITYEDKVSFLGFLEQIALLVNSKLLSIQVASYVYGYYVTKCAESKNFWTEELDKDSAYWNLFFSFSRKCSQIQPESISPNKLRF
jgi:hypothetical protein